MEVGGAVASEHRFDAHIRIGVGAAESVLHVGFAPPRVKVAILVAPPKTSDSFEARRFCEGFAAPVYDGRRKDVSAIPVAMP